MTGARVKHKVLHKPAEIIVAGQTAIEGTPLCRSRAGGATGLTAESDLRPALRAVMQADEGSLHPA